MAGVDSPSQTSPVYPIIYAVRDAMKRLHPRATVGIIALWLVIIGLEVGPDHPLTRLTPDLPWLWSVAFYATALSCAGWALRPNRFTVNAAFLLLTLVSASRAFAALLLADGPQYVTFGGWMLVLTLWWEAWPALALDSLARAQRGG